MKFKMKMNLKTALLFSSALLLWTGGTCPIYASQKTNLATLSVPNLPQAAKASRQGLMDYLEALKKEGTITEATRQAAEKMYDDSLQRHQMKLPAILDLLKASQHAASEHKEELIKLQKEHHQLKEKFEQVEKGGGLNETQKKQLEEFTALLTSGNQDFEKSLYLYTFMIKDHSHIIDEVLKKTKGKMQDIERQREDFESDRKVPLLIDFLKTPKKASHEDVDSMIVPLEKSVDRAIEALTLLKAEVQKDSSVHTNILRGNFEGSLNSSKPYSYLLQKLKSFQSVLSKKEILGIKHAYSRFLKETPEFFEKILKRGKGAAGAEMLNYISSFKERAAGTLKDAMVLTEDALEALSKLGHEKAPDNQCEKYKIFFEKIEGNILLDGLNPKQANENFSILINNQEYFETEDLKFPVDSQLKFQKNAALKLNFTNLLWVRELKKNKAFEVAINKIENLKYPPTGQKGKELNESWYSDESKIDKMLYDTFIKVILGIQKSGKDDKLSITDDADFKALETNFYDPNSFTVLNDIVDLAILKEKPKNAFLEITRDLYNAQYCHASLIKKLGELRGVIGNHFKELESKQNPDLVEARAIKLRQLCDTFEKNPYYLLNPHDRSETYVWTLDALALPEVLGRLNVQADEQSLIIKALKEAHAAYLAVREAIVKFGTKMERKEREERIWNGFNMDAPLLKSFDVLLEGSKGGSSGAAPLPAPMPPPLPSHGPGLPPPPLPSPGGKKTSPEIEFLNAHKADANYVSAVLNFFDEVVNNWTKFDYAPTFDRLKEIIESA
jgi:hypothetical protein